MHNGMSSADVSPVSVPQTLVGTPILDVAAVGRPMRQRTAHPTF